MTLILDRYRCATFEAVLAAELTKAHAAKPGVYAWPIERAPVIAAECIKRMDANIRSVTIKGGAMIATMQTLRIHRTYTALHAYLNGEAESRWIAPAK